MDSPQIALDRTLILEDDPHAQQRMKRLLDAVVDGDANARIAGDLADARELLMTVPNFSLALVDVQLPDGNGIDFIAWMQRNFPQVPAVVVSAWAEEGTILSAIGNGAIGYLLKESDDAELLVALRCLQRGGAAIDPVIARRILQLLPAQSPALFAAPNQPTLSEREMEILRMVSQGLTNRDIAENLHVSRHTIESHASKIYRKLAVGSRTEAIFEARSMGLL